MEAMKKIWHMTDWLRLFGWIHALGTGGFYCVVWLRTRTDGTKLSRVPSELEESLPAVALIVPARNEERNIYRCVTSLLEQTYPNYSVLVVDDGSTDRTAQILREIAETHPQRARLQVLRAPELPASWAGKPHALHTGVQQSHGELLLFTDADTWHAPDALLTTVTYFRKKQLDLLSLGTTQELPGFWEKVMMPMAYLGISLQYPSRQVNDPRNPLALANGQYILLRRAVYERLGGYARADLRGTLLDDRDLARLVKKQGYALEMADGRDLVRVRMYQGLREIWSGWRKNVFLGSRGGLPFVLLQLLGLPMVTVLPFLLPPLLWLSRLRQKKQAVSVGALTIFSLLELGPLLTYRRWSDRELALPWYSSLTHPLAGILFMGILAQSTWRVLTRRGVNWRGRDYFKER